MSQSLNISKSNSQLKAAHEFHEGRECLESRKYPESLGSHGYPESREYPVSPVSNGQEPENELEALAVRCACTSAQDNVREKLFELARGVRALEKQNSGWRLETRERLFVFNKWHDASKQFLDDTKDYLAEFLAAIPKVRVPTGGGDTLKNAINNVSKLSLFELPMIPEMPAAPESWRRLVALHYEL